MKLAEGLALRADAVRRVEQLRARIVASARYQEGEKPPEDAAALLARPGPVRHRRNRPGHDPVPAAAHLVSWAGLCPSARQSGPRTRAGKKGQGDTWLRGTLGQAANGADRTQTFLGERYHRILRRRAKAKAQVAVARSIPGQVAGARCRAPAP